MCETIKAAAIVTSNPALSTAGGVERFNYYLERYLCKKGYSVDYYHSGTLKKTGLLKLRYISIILIQFLTGRQLKDLGKYSLIISNGGYGCGIRKKKNVKYLNFHHGTMPGLQDALRSKTGFRKYFLNKYLTYGLTEFLSGIKSKRIAVGNSVAEDIKRYFHSESSVLCNAADTDYFKPVNNPERNRRELTCLFIARFDYWVKGFDFLEKLTEALENVKWILLINGKHEIKSSETVRVYENVKYEDLPAFYKKADIGFYLSRYEGNSYSLLELLAFGLPVIATQAGEAKYIYKNEILKSLLIKSSIEDECAIEEVKQKVDDLRDINKRRVTGQAGRKIIEEKYSMEKWEQRLSEILDEKC